jgi:hypothetical protein
MSAILVVIEIGFDLVMPMVGGLAPDNCLVAKVYPEAVLLRPVKQHPKSRGLKRSS